LRGFPEAPKDPEPEPEIAAGKNIDDPGGPASGNTGIGAAGLDAAAGGSGAASGGVTVYRGGMTKGKPGRKSPTRTHGGEFVMNAEATKAMKPQLEALNALIPAKPRDGADLDAIIRKASKFIDV
jgi:hypothetical protein